MTTANIPPQLIEALQNHSLALFIGADLPKTVTGLPSRTDLACDLAGRYGLTESSSLTKVSEQLGKIGKRAELTNFIHNQLDTTGISPTAFHRRVVELVREYKVKTILTTTYDNLLEMAFQEARLGLNRVICGGGTNLAHTDNPTLIKLYGDAAQPDTLVITERDHSRLLHDRDKKELVNEVRRAFRSNSVLILGYDLSDPAFRFIYDQIAESRFARLAFAIWPGLSEVHTHMWRDRGIVLLEADPFGLLSETQQRTQTLTSPAAGIHIGSINGVSGGVISIAAGDIHHHHYERESERGEKPTAEPASKQAIDRPTDANDSYNDANNQG